MVGCRLDTLINMVVVLNPGSTAMHMGFTSRSDLIDVPKRARGSKEAVKELRTNQAKRRVRGLSPPLRTLDSLICLRTFIRSNLFITSKIPFNIRVSQTYITCSKNRPYKDLVV